MDPPPHPVTPLPPAKTARFALSNHGLKILLPSLGADEARPPPLEGSRTPQAAKSSQQRTRLHELVLLDDLLALERALQADASAVDAQEENGFTALMAASSLADPAASSAAVQLLLRGGARPEVCDKDGFSAAHWAAALGNVDALRALVAAAPLLATAASAVNGETPLHRASRLGQAEAARVLVGELGASASAQNFAFQTAVDVAGGFWPDARQAARAGTGVRAALFAQAPRERTLVLFHADCLLHSAGQGSAHQEAPERQVEIVRELGRAGLLQDAGARVSSDFPPAELAAVELAHDAGYVAMVRALDAQTRASRAPVAFTPRVQRALARAEKDERQCDTYFSPGTLQASLRAVGAVVHAVEQVLAGAHRNAFCVVRPPGHHAGVRGLLDEASSCGFCVFNSVAVGALSAQAAGAARRVAIVDFDVHHGNGTQEIVLKRFKNKSDVLFFSLHLFDKDEDPVGMLDAAERHKTGGPGKPVADDRYCFYPGSGRTDIWEQNVVRVCAGGELTRSQAEFRRQIEAKLVPLLRSFGPDLVLISAGFDAGAGDIGCSKLVDGRVAGHGADLLPQDFAWITTQICKVADVCCQGRVVSVLEGGYGKWSKDPVVEKDQPRTFSINRDSLAKNAAAHLAALLRLPDAGM